MVSGVQSLDAGILTDVRVLSCFFMPLYDACAAKGVVLRLGVSFLRSAVGPLTCTSSV
jgi:hypothetical protein